MSAMDRIRDFILSPPPDHELPKCTSSALHKRCRLIPIAETGRFTPLRYERLDQHPSNNEELAEKVACHDCHIEPSTAVSENSNTQHRVRRHE